MLITVDVGNTQTHIGAFDGSELVADWRFTTEVEASYDELALVISPLVEAAEVSLAEISGSIVASVVPELAPAYSEMFKRHGAGRRLEVGPELKLGLAILVENPRGVGADRLVNAIGAFDRFAGPCVAVDFGTSTNFDVVSGEGAYLGGAIGPGLEVSIEALNQRTAKLPRIDLAEPSAAIGRNTEAAMHSGFIYGFAGLVDGIARRVEAEIGADAAFVATGGLAGAIAPHCETIDEIDPLLTLRGLRLIWERNQ